MLTGSGYVVTGDRYISLGVRVPGRIEAYLVEEGRARREGPAARAARRARRTRPRSPRRAPGSPRRARRRRSPSKELKRLRELRAQDVASQADLDVKETQLARGARQRRPARGARSRSSSVDLDDTVLRAPTDGVVLEKLKEVSEIAVPGGFAGSGELIRMANTDELRAELDVNEIGPRAR